MVRLVQQENGDWKIFAHDGDPGAWYQYPASAAHWANEKAQALAASKRASRYQVQLADGHQFPVSLRTVGGWRPLPRVQERYDRLFRATGSVFMDDLAEATRR